MPAPSQGQATWPGHWARTLWNIRARTYHLGIPPQWATRIGRHISRHSTIPLAWLDDVVQDDHSPPLPYTAIEAWGDGAEIYSPFLGQFVDHQTGLWRLAYKALRQQGRIPEVHLLQLAHHIFGTIYPSEISQMLRLSAQSLRMGYQKPLLWHCLSPDLPSGLWTSVRRWQMPHLGHPFPSGMRAS